MVDLNIKLLAQELNISVDELINICSKLGILEKTGKFINISDKDILLKNIHKNLNTVKKPITLQRKTRSILNVISNSGKNRSIQIEIRKKHTFFKNKIERNKLLENKNNINHMLNDKSHVNINKIQEELIIEHSVNDKKKITTSTKNKIINDKIINLKLSDKSISIKKCNHNNYNYDVKNTKNKSNNCIFLKEEKKIFKDKLNHRIDKKDIKKEYRSINFLNTRHTEYNDLKEIDSKRRTKNKKIKNIHNKKNYITTLNIKKDQEESKSIFCVSNNYKKKNSNSLLQQSFKKPIQIVNRDILIGEKIIVSELANKMAVKSAELIKKMMNLGIIVTINQTIDKDTAQLIAEEMGHKVIVRNENELEELLINDIKRCNSKAKISLRSPVVTIMGHVDHGKTSLLDSIRSSQVVSQEAGGITQHIGAYCVKTKYGIITFLDTPGHAAFTAMRARGAQVTDIVILVIAVDDGIMPQTIESIQHAKAANVPIIVAMNKIDKIENNIDKLKKELMKYSIVAEEWGGDNIFVNISAKLGQGIDNLLNAISLQAEMLDLKAFFNGMSSGIVIEAFLDKGRGPIATVLVREGILKQGDILICGCAYGKVRAMRDENCNFIVEAGPSIPVQILGLSHVPNIGDIFTVVNNEKKARDVALYRQIKYRETKLSGYKRIKLENVFNNLSISNGITELNIVLKSDVQGSLEAISDALLKLSNQEVIVKIIGSGVGGITETDVSLAVASNAILLGFNVRPNSSAKRMILLENVNIRYYSVIYQLIEEVKQSILGLLSPKHKQEIIGLAIVRSIFKSPKFSEIAGCMVTEGIIKKNKSVRILRNNTVIYQGELESLRRFKEDVVEVRKGMECGIGIKNYNNIHINDLIEVMEEIEC
ncbi:translation initiation factor IF-2 [Buchnera aphidicola (Formosaphis micheliae)]|uniref:translation initiation factor IF-2 n=1 Tax=Buchnera aphidicola TaxID=9 RepID=UPI0031CCC9EC